MPFTLFKNSDSSYFSIDVGSQYTKFIDVTLSKGKTCKVNEFIVKPTPEGSFKAGKILNQSKLSGFLIQSIIDIGFGKKNNIVAGIAAKGVIVKKIDIPKMEEKLIPEHLPFEVEQYIPYDISEMDLDYEVLKGMSAPPDTIPVLFVAILKKTVQEYLDLFSEAQLNCDILDGNMFALSNAFEYNYGVQSKKNIMICDVGGSCTTLVGICNGQMVFARSVPVGAGFYTQEIQKSLGVTPQEAEELKKNAGESGGGAGEVAEIIEKSHSGFCEELKSGYEFYTNFFPDNEISEMFITGGGSRMKGLSSVLQKAFSVPCKDFKPFQKVSLPSHLKKQEKRLSAYAATAFGLSLRTKG